VTLRRAGRRLGWILGLGLAALPGLAVAQPPPQPTPVVVRPPTPPRVEVAVLGVFVSGTDLDVPDATGLGNRVPTASTATFFRTDARLRAGSGVEVRGSVRLTGAWFAEGGVAYTRPSLDVRLDDDVEGATPVTASVRLLQVVADGALVRRVGRGRLMPFAAVGGGYLRQLDAPRTSVATGQVWYGGGGVLVGWRRGPADRQRVRLRADVRVMGTRGGLALVDTRGPALVATAGVSVRAW